MNKKKVIALALVTMLSLGGLTGCNKKNDTTKTDNKETTTETETEKKDETSSTEESKDNQETTDNDDKKTDSTDKKNESTDSKKNNNSSSTNTSSSNKSNNSSSTASKPSSGSNNSAPSKTEETKPSHTHTWVDHTATKQVPRTVHHDAVYETVTIPAVTKWQFACMGCGQWFDSEEDFVQHAFGNPVNDECGSQDPAVEREVVITPARTEKKLVKKAYDETVYDKKSYVDYQYCSGCGQKK